MLVYTPHITPRIEYILQYFNERLFIDAEVTDEVDRYRASDEARLNYSHKRIDSTEFFIQSAGLLQQHDVRKQPVNCFDWKGVKAFFETADDLGFDLFSAVFYLITRYEEYTEHEPDEYGRYAHWNSLAWKEGFLHQPLIDIWLTEFSRAFKLKFTSFKLPAANFNFLPTYDIDIAWSYKHKGFIRNIVSSLNKPSSIAERISVLTGKQKDPYDAYEWLEKFHEANNLEPIFFFLVAAENSEYDKNISPGKKALQQLIQSTAKQAGIALHPSTQSNTNKELLLKEKNVLQQISGKKISAARYHYILFHLPHSYRELVAAGFTDEYSMGYGTVNGFRASTCHSFLWYDLEREEKTSLRIHPYAYMEANSFYELHQSPAEALEEMKFLAEEVKKVNGRFISIFHNHILGTEQLFKGWREMYEEFVNTVTIT